MTFSTKHGLQIHSKSVHEKIRDFCKICTYRSSEKGFVVKQILNKGTSQVHFDIRPLQCDTCEARSYTRRNLRKHMKGNLVALKDQHLYGRAFRELKDLESHMHNICDKGARSPRERAELERRCEETGYVIISLKGPKSRDGMITCKHTPTFAESSKSTPPSKTISVFPKDSALEVQNQTLGSISKDANRMRKRQKDAQRKREKRQKETPAEREARLRNYQTKMTPELRKLDADRKRKSRANETPAEREYRLQRVRESQRRSRENRSYEFRQKDARRKREERQKESQAKRVARLAAMRIYNRTKERERQQLSDHWDE